MTYPDGRVEEGNWKNGKFVKESTTSSPSSTPTEVKRTLDNGAVYEGEAVNGKFNGKGKSTSADGNVYEGDYVNGKQTGKGKCTYTDGDVYEGDFVDDNPHGKGKMTTADGKVFVGNWENGKFAGNSQMKILKNLSIVSLVGYPLYFFFSIFLFLNEHDLIIIVVNVICLLYFVSQTVMCLLQGNKTKNTVLKVSSIICFVAVLTSIIIKDIYYSAVDFVIPFAIVLSIIALVQLSKALKQKIKE